MIAGIARLGLDRRTSGAMIVRFSVRLFILSCISGLLSYLSVSLPHLLSNWMTVSDDAFFVFPGLFFGLFILAPRVKKGNHRTLRRAGVLIFSVGAWLVAVAIGLQVLPWVHRLAMLSCGISGIIGVLLLMAASRYLVPLHLDIATIVTVIVVGFIGGIIIGMALVQPRTSVASEFLYFFGFLMWHCGVGAALFGRDRTTADS
jgi:hypothetical protein